MIDGKKAQKIGKKWRRPKIENRQKMEEAKSPKGQ
jgi:hypothetical protein